MIHSQISDMTVQSLTARGSIAVRNPHPQKKQNDEKFTPLDTTTASYVRPYRSRSIRVMHLLPISEKNVPNLTVTVTMLLREDIQKSFYVCSVDLILRLNGLRIMTALLKSSDPQLGQKCPPVTCLNSIHPLFTTSFVFDTLVSS